MFEAEERKMPSCKNCGNELPEGAGYCPKCGTPVQAKPPLRLAFWGERFLAWLVDIVILGIIMVPISVLTWFGWSGFAILPRLPNWTPFLNFGLSNVIYFLYWMLMEGITGRSLGKMLMRLKVTRLDGGPMDMGQAAIESVGKAFLLPLDMILGWILYPSKRQRMFNYLSGTVVLKA
jgi:uncharacterized RDD family membrane protein YckC